VFGKMRTFLRSMLYPVINVINGFNGSNNKILSPYVSYSAMRGTNITVMNGTFIDRFSQINSYTYVGFNCFVTKANIGRYSSIANNISIGMGEHKLDRISTSSIFYAKPYDVLTEHECCIGNDCWIGVDSIIRRGVNIGDGAVIGANSFVNQDVPSFAIVAGSPARIIRYRYSPTQIKEITNLHWWDYGFKEARERIDYLESVIYFNRKH